MDTSRWRVLVPLLMLAAVAPAGAGDDDEDGAEAPAIVEPMSATSLADYQELMALQILPLLTPGASEDRARACRALPYSGLTAPALFDRLEQSLLREYEQAVAEDDEVPRGTPSCVRALASSGDPRYAATVRKWVDSKGIVNRRLKRNILDKAPADLANFAAWNLLINAATHHKPRQPWPVTRTVNLLKSGEDALQREGMKRLKDQGAQYPWLYDVVEAALLQAYRSDDPERANTAAFMCKWLAQSGNARYRATLDKVAADSPSEKLRKHAERAAESLADGGS